MVRAGFNLKSKTTNLSLNDRFTVIRQVSATPVGTHVTLQSEPRVTKKSKKIIAQMEKRPAVLAALKRMKLESFVPNQQVIPAQINLGGRNVNRLKKQNQPTAAKKSQANGAVQKRSLAQRLDIKQRIRMDVKKRITTSVINRTNVAGAQNKPNLVQNRTNLAGVLRGAGGAKGVQRVNFKVQANRQTQRSAVQNVQIGQDSVKMARNNRGNNKQRGGGSFVQQRISGFVQKGRGGAQNKGGRGNNNNNFQNNNARRGGGVRGGFRTSKAAGNGYWMTNRN